MMHSPDIFGDQKVPKGILLDLDNTLYEYEPCHAHALNQCHERYNRIVQPVDFETFCRLYLEGRAAVKEHNRSTAGSRSRHLYFQRMLEKLHGRTDAQKTLQLGDLYWEAFMDAMTVRPWVVEFLQTARERRCAVVVITNQESSLQFKKLIRLGLDAHIDFVVTSEEAGVEKPDPRIFLLALDKIGMKPDDVVMIGDDQKEDGAGAARVGISYVPCD